MRILIVDDNPSDRALARREVQRERSDAEIVEADSLAALDHAIQEPIDVAVLDYSLGWGTGVDALHRLKAAQPDAGAVLFTGSLGEERAVEALKAGFDDYVIKGAPRLSRLRAAVHTLARQAGERRAARQLRERYEALFRTVPVGLFVCGPDGRFEDGNERLLQLLGAKTLDDLRRHSLRELLVAEGTGDWSGLTEAGEAGMEATLRGGGADERAVLLHATQVPGDSGFQGAITDVTALRKALEQKDLLLRELFHRVYNNLQAVQGLLLIQAKRFADPAVRQAFADVSDRIGAMALVQRKLHRGDDYQRLDFAGYLADLLDAGRSQMGRPEVEVHLEAEPLHVDIERAMPLGLIASELLCNALKHAFPKGSAGTVRIELRKVEQTVRLTVADDGVGAPASLLHDNAGVGLDLVRRMVRQIDGAMVIEDQSGVRVEITTPL